MAGRRWMPGTHNAFRATSVRFLNPRVNIETDLTVCNRALTVLRFNRNLGQMLGRGPVFFHVAMGRHCEGIRWRDAEWHLVLLIATFGHGPQSKVRRQSGKQTVASYHQNRVDQPASDCGGTEMEHGRGGCARNLQRVRECGRNTHVLAQGDAEAMKRGCEGVTTQHAIYILLPQASVANGLAELGRVAGAIRPELG